MAYSSAGQWNVLLSNGAGFTFFLWAGHSGGQSNSLVVHCDGDGRTDIAVFNGSAWQVCLSTGSSSSAFTCSSWGGPGSYVYNSVLGDFNGDGRTDIAGYTGIGGSWQVCISTGTGFDCGSQYWATNISGDVNTMASKTLVGDFNGDGKTDMAAWTQSGSMWAVCLSTGAGFACDYPNINGAGVGGTVTGDFNGDGRTDLVSVAGDGIHLLFCYGLYASGTSFSCVAESTADVGTAVNARSALRVGDFNGDGLADLAQYISDYVREATPPYYAIELAVDLNASLVPDLVTAVNNGLGHQPTIAYQPLTKSTVYTKDSGANAAVWPDEDLQVPLQVVASASSQNGLGGLVITNYTYGGAKVDLKSGRGFKGFRWREETPQATSIKTHITYRQDWPYIGMPAQVTRTLSNGTTVILQTDNSYSCKDFTGGCTVAAGKRYLPFVTQGTTTTRDLDNSFITTLRTTTLDTQIDDYGNVLNVEVKNLTSGGADEGFVKTTVSTYDNDTTNWLLGRLRTSAVTKTIPGGSPETRSSYFEYDATSGLLTKEVIEPSSSAYCLVSTYGYDAFGNKNSVTTRNCNASSGEAVAPTGDPVFTARTSNVYFDTSAGCTAQSGYAQGRFPVRNVNALGHAECLEHDPGFGGATKLTGPNGLITAWQYDEFGRKTLETRADGTKTAWAYLACAGAPCPTGATYRLEITPEDLNGAQSGPISSIYYDVLNREMRSETQGFDGTAIYKDTTYDDRGRVLTVTRPYYSGQTVYSTTYAYDDADRVTSETLPATSGGTAKKAITYSGLTVTQTLSNNGSSTNMPARVTQTKTTTKNSQGQVTQATDSATPTANVVTFTYWASGNMKDTTSASIVTSLSYDLRGRKTQMTDKDMGTWYYYYNALGELIRQTDAKSQTTTMLYDLLGRMTHRGEQDLVSDWYYDTLEGTQAGTTCGSGVVTSKGKLCKATGDNGYVRTSTYDTLGRPSAMSTTIDTGYTISYGYDVTTGRLSQTTYPTGYAIKNLYNSYGYLSEIIDAGNTVSFWSANSLSASGKVLNETVSYFHDLSWIGTPTVRQYDALDRLTSTTTTDAANAAHQFNFTYDAIGNVTQKVDVLQANLTENFAFDSRNFLTATSGSGLTTPATNYDPSGNISYKSNVGTYNYPAVTAAQPHAPSSITGTVVNCANPSFSYDVNGNLSSGLGRTYTYTSYNMPSRIVGTRTCGGTSSQYDYTYI